MDAIARHEWHSAHARTASSVDGAKKILANYHGKNAAVAKGFTFKPGFIYTQVRAISARINQNYDGWPSSELKKSFRTFIGKPVFVNHQNFDYKKARGKVVAARYIEAGDDKYIETVMEIDAARFPKLAHEIKTGGLDSVSMGVEAGFTICSYCNNKAVDVPDFCSHVKYHKGRVLPRSNARTGAKEDVLVYEKCFKLGFFELSYVFDPADETAVVSRVIAASTGTWMDNVKKCVCHRPWPHDADGDMISKGYEHLVPKGHHPIDDRPFSEHSYDHREHSASAADQAIPGNPDEIAEGQMAVSNMPTWNMPTASRDNARVHHYAYGEIEAPEDIDTLRSQQNDETKDPFKHYVESPKELQGPDLDQTKLLDRNQEQEGLDGDRRVEDIEDVGGQPMPRAAHYLVDPRTGRKYYAADDGPPPPSGKSDEELLSEAEDDLKKAEGAGSPPPGSNAGGSDDDASDSDSDSDDDSDSDSDDDDDDSDAPPSKSKSSDSDSDSDKPPWLKGKESRRRNGNGRSSHQNKRREGAPMSLAKRGQVVASRQLRRYADDSGHTDGGPYGENDQGEQEDVYLSQTPSAEAVSAPTPGDGTISNTEKNLVARIQQRNAQQQRDIIAYEQITGRRLATGIGDSIGGADPMGPSQLGGETNLTNLPSGPPPGAGIQQGLADGEGALPPMLGYHYAEAVDSPDKVNPTVTDSESEKLTGDDFESLALDNTQTQPKDASVHAFRAFDSWVHQTTGRTARQHANPNFIRRAAARYCSAAGVPVEALFPALGSVLREARKSEGGSNMQRRADTELEVAAPQDRIDVEAPVRNVTDADAQRSQDSLSDFGGNASDNLASPELSPDSQIWAPGEGNSSGFKNSNRKADGITAVRYAEAFIKAGLADDTPEEKWKIAGLAQTMRHGAIVDRIRILDACNAVTQRRIAALQRQYRTAGNQRGAGRSQLPPGLGSRQFTAGTPAANDIATDSAMFFKG